MEDPYLKKIMTAGIILILLVLSFFMLRPILSSIIIALILAFICSPIYDKLNSKINSKNITAAIICFLLILLIVIPLWFLTPIIIDQSFKLYLGTQKVDLVTPLKNFFPSFFASKEFSAEVGSILQSFISKSANSLMNSFSNLILNFPEIFLHLIVMLFTFFFVLREREDIVNYIKSLLPFSNEVEKKLFDSSKAITYSVIYGQIVVGIAQGLAVGTGFLIFKVPNALLLTLFACLAGIFPIIGTTIVWLPVMIYLFMAGSNVMALGVLFFGIISNLIDNLIRPIIVSKKAQMNSALILIGMIGGLFFFGILGFILGPLILAYLLIILEIYRGRGPKFSGVFIQPTE